MQIISSDTPKENHDPLYLIFEQHLFQFQDANEDRKTFSYNVVQEYLAYLRKKNIAIPHAIENEIIQELTFQVSTMLTKKIYGFYDIDSFVAQAPKELKKRAKRNYKKVSG